MKTFILKPGVLSLFFIALMIYLSCQKQNHDEMVSFQKINSSGVNEPLKELKLPNAFVIKSITDLTMYYDYVTRTKIPGIKILL